MGARKRKDGGKSGQEKTGSKKKGKKGSPRKATISESSQPEKEMKSEAGISGSSDFSDDDDSSNGKFKVRGPIPVKKHRVSPTLMVSMVIMFTVIAGGVYVLNFTDVRPEDIIETVQKRSLEIFDAFAQEQIVPTDDDSDGREQEKPEVPKADTTRKEPVKEEPTKVEPVEEEPVKVEPVIVEPPKVEPVEVEPPKEEPVKVEPVEVEAPKVEPPKVEPVEVEPPKVEPLKQEPVKDEPPKEEPPQEEPAKEEPMKEEPPKEEPVKDEPAKEEPPKEAPKEEAVKKETKTKSQLEREKYARADITNQADFAIRVDLDEADSWIDANKPTEAVKIYDRLLTRHAQSARATYGRARAFDVQAELERSNRFLEQSITEYMKVLDLPDVPKALNLKAGRRCAERQTFRGWSPQAGKTIRRLIDMYPEETELWNDLGVKYLMSGKNEDARLAFQQVLKQQPDNGLALVHLGFIIKQTDNDNAGAIPYLQEGIASGLPGTQDGRFFFHLGDALYRIGNHTEAYALYEEGAKKKIFMSKYQRSLYNVDSLTGRPWWTPKQSRNEKYLKVLEENWETIRDEGLAQMDTKTGSFKPEDENLRETGDWKQFTLFSQGRKNEENCKKAPKTCALIDQFPDAAGCKRGQVKYSVMHPGVHVWPHCGPTNCRIRAHLGLVVPEGPRIRVADDHRTWKEGEFIIFDDSFEHEVWHDGESFRLVLIVDMWHPDLTTTQKRSLSAI